MLNLIVRPDGEGSEGSHSALLIRQQVEVESRLRGIPHNGGEVHRAA